jgi:hypothetical protein
MNIYTYVAQCNPSMAKAICHKYGYKLTGVQSKSDLGVCLEQLVAKEGESALNDIVNNHPDRDLIIEMSGVETKHLNMEGFSNYTGGRCNCGCNNKPNKKYDEFVNYIGEESIARTSLMNNQTNSVIIASAFLLGVAILSKKL